MIWGDCDHLDDIGRNKKDHTYGILEFMRFPQMPQK